MKSNSTFVVLSVGISLAIHCAARAVTVPALTLPNGNQDVGWPVADSVHGWRFVPHVPIRVTHLGLFDTGPQVGFVIDHPIGLFRFSDGAQLTGGTLPQGFQADTLPVDSFRFIDTPDVTLTAEESYVVAFYTSQGMTDFMVSSPNPPGLSITPAITMTNALFKSGSFSMPASIAVGQTRIGPNFLYEVVPEVSTAWLAVLSVIEVSLVRRKRV